MAKFRYKGRGSVDANGYHWEPQGITEVPDDDVETLQKLRGRRGGASHPSFEEVR